MKERLKKLWSWLLEHKLVFGLALGGLAVLAYYVLKVRGSAAETSAAGSTGYISASPYGNSVTAGNTDSVTTSQLASILSGYQESSQEYINNALTAQQDSLSDILSANQESMGSFASSLTESINNALLSQNTTIAGITEKMNTQNQSMATSFADQLKSVVDSVQTAINKTNENLASALSAMKPATNTAPTGNATLPTTANSIAGTGVSSVIPVSAVSGGGGNLGISVGSQIWDYGTAYNVPINYNATTKEVTIGNKVFQSGSIPGTTFSAGHNIISDVSAFLTAVGAANNIAASRADSSNYSRGLSSITVPDLPDVGGSLIGSNNNGAVVPISTARSYTAPMDGMGANVAAPASQQTKNVEYVGPAMPTGLGSTTTYSYSDSLASFGAGRI